MVTRRRSCFHRCKIGIVTRSTDTSEAWLIFDTFHQLGEGKSDCDAAEYYAQTGTMLSYGGQEKTVNRERKKETYVSKVATEYTNIPMVARPPSKNFQNSNCHVEAPCVTPRLRARWGGWSHSR
ncbi:hypothetical protein [Bradyrhizobium sp. USDA 3650]